MEPSQTSFSNVIFLARRRKWIRRKGGQGRMGVLRKGTWESPQHKGKEELPQLPWLVRAASSAIGTVRRVGELSSGSGEGVEWKLREANKWLMGLDLRDSCSLGRMQLMAAELRNWDRIQARRTGGWTKGLWCPKTFANFTEQPSRTQRNAGDKGSWGGDRGEAARGPLLLDGLCHHHYHWSDPGCVLGTQRLCRHPHRWASSLWEAGIINIPHFQVISETECWMNLPKVTQLAHSTPGPPLGFVTTTCAISQHFQPSSELLKTGADLNLPRRVAWKDSREKEVGQTRVAGSKAKAQVEVEASWSCACRVGKCRADSSETAKLCKTMWERWSAQLMSTYFLQGAAQSERRKHGVCLLGGDEKPAQEIIS